MYQKYAEIKAQIASLEEERAILAEKILADMVASRENTKETDYGTFGISKKSSWTYSAKLKRLEDEVKIKKLDEQKNGTAKAEIKEFIIFKTHESTTRVRG